MLAGFVWIWTRFISKHMDDIKSTLFSESVSTSTSTGETLTNDATLRWNLILYKAVNAGLFFSVPKKQLPNQQKKTITEQIVEQTRYIWRIVRYKNFGCPDSGQTTDLLGVCIVIEGFHRHWRYTSSLRMSIVIYGVYRYWRYVWIVIKMFIVIEGVHRH